MIDVKDLEHGLDRRDGIGLRVGILPCPASRHIYFRWILVLHAAVSGMRGGFAEHVLL